MLFDKLTQIPPDPILMLGQMFRDDPRTDKMDLGVGVFKDEHGNTTIMNAVKKAEALLLDAQETKTYVGMAGDREFNRLVGRMIFGENVDQNRLAAIQTPGGSGAVRLLADLIAKGAAKAGNSPTVWLSSPTWSNHMAILDSAGLRWKHYPYLDAHSRAVDFDKMLTALRVAEKGDVVLLHGCCHNPSGADLTKEQWQVIGELALERGFTPFVDLAYQGFGDGLEEDATGVRILAHQLPELLVASSCSKNFAIYRERTGCALVLGDNAHSTERTFSTMTGIARSSYSMPPDHGSAIVRSILSTPALRENWLGELEDMRLRIQKMRTSLANELRLVTNSDHYDHLADHKGMFSLLGLSVDQVNRLREEFGIYIVGDSRINVAGLRGEYIKPLAIALNAIKN